MIAFIDEAHTLLIVVQTVVTGNPAPKAHWRATFCPSLGYAVSRGSTARTRQTQSIPSRQNISHQNFVDVFSLQSRDSSQRRCFTVSAYSLCDPTPPAILPLITWDPKSTALNDESDLIPRSEVVSVRSPTDAHPLKPPMPVRALATM